MPPDNKIDVGQWVGVRLIVDGWQKKKGKYTLMLKSRSLRATENSCLIKRTYLEIMPDGLSSEDAKALTLSARMTAIDKLYDYFTVTFRVWDKQSQNEISGSYKLYLK